MKKPSKAKAQKALTFSQFLDDPLISVSFLVFALTVLFLAILEFGSSL